MDMLNNVENKSSGLIIPFNYRSLNDLKNIDNINVLLKNEYRSDLPKALLCGDKVIVFYEKSFYSLGPQEREDIFNSNQNISIITDDVVIFRDNVVIPEKLNKLTLDNPDCVFNGSELVKFDDPIGYTSSFEMDSTITKVKDNAFDSKMTALIKYDGTMKECLDVFEKQSSFDMLVIVCDDGVIQFINEANHIKAKGNLSYFFCYHGFESLLDNAIINHNMYTFLHRRYSIFARYCGDLLSYASNTAMSVSSEPNDYYILDLDNFLKITVIDYENG